MMLALFCKSILILSGVITTKDNGASELTQSYTQDYLIALQRARDPVTLTAVFDRNYSFGDGINLTAITDNLISVRSESYTYTAANRLQQGTGIWGTLDWTYDLVGNRTSEVLTSGGASTDTYNYPGTSNRLATIAQGASTVRSFTYDGAGNVTADARGATTYNYRYNQRGRLDRLTIGATVTANYTYDGLERMAIRTTQNMTPAGTAHYLYDLDGHLLVEADAAGATLREYVWLDDLPLAVVADVNTPTPNLYFVHADQLKRPLKMTDPNKAVVWDAVYRPFGEIVSITGSATNNLRFPGQYFLIEDGLHYNWHRQYDPTIGRYVQSDPLAFVDGPNVFAYAVSSPIQDFDPSGRETIVTFWQPRGYGKSAFGHISININRRNFSFGPRGWDTNPDADDYNRRNMSFRSGTGLLLNLTPQEEQRLQTCLEAKTKPYNTVANNCTGPIQQCLPPRVIIPRDRILPRNFADDLLRSPALVTPIPYRQIDPDVPAQ
jgi:RHS repeat-associated protein